MKNPEHVTPDPIDPQPKLEDSSVILERSRALIKPINTKLKQLQEKYIELRYAYGASSGKEGEAISEDMQKNLEEQEQLKLERNTIEEEAKLNIKTRSGKKNT